MVVHVVREALSRDPGVICGVSPTESEADFLAFFSRYFFDKVLRFSTCGRKLGKGMRYLSFCEYSRSMIARSL